MRHLLHTTQLRVTGLAIVVVAVVLGIAVTLAVLAQRDALTGNLDDRLARRADDIVALVTRGSTPATLAVGDDDALAQLVSAGSVIAASENAAELPIIAEPPPTGDERLTTVEGLPVDDGEFRMFSRRFEAAGVGYVLHVAAALDDVNEAVATLTMTLAVTLLVVLAVVAGILWTVVGRALRTVEAAHSRLEQFVADASHELRSPLTSIRSELEVDLAHPNEADLLATQRSVLDDTVRLQRLVDELLFLARRDNGKAELRHDIVDLDEIVLGEAKALRSRNRVAVDSSRVSGAQVTGDAELLRRAVRNVLDNAERHAASTVTVALSELDDRAVLSVADDGPGIPSEQLTRIFERFARIDQARDRQRGGAGLGLAITREIVTQHQGTIAVDPSESGARFVIRLPLSSTQTT
jgi:signal transduction histidine kinase